MPLDIVSTTEEMVHLKIAPVTSTGKPALLDGLPTWAITTGGATIVVDADGMGAFVVSEDIGGSSTWSVSADADLGAGVSTISDGGVYSYASPQAAALGITADAPVPKVA